MGSPLGPPLANSFLCCHEKRWLDKCPEEFKPVFHRQYVDNIFVLFRKEEHPKLFLNYFNSCHENVKFTSEKETNNKLSFQFTVNPNLVKYFLILIVAFPGVTNST